MEDPTSRDDVARLRAAIERADAPAALQLRVAQQIAQERKRRARRRKVSAGVLATGGALAAAVTLFVLPHRSPPSVAQVVRVAAETPRAPAPAVDRADPRRLVAHVDRVWFPSWRALRWRAAGLSRERVAGRPAVTVYYAGAGSAPVAYTIVGGGTLPWPEHARAVTSGWMRLRVYSDDGHRVVTWRERGHQCVLAGPRSLPEATLLALAADEA